jgi:predicted small lipoprotein YifL
MHTRSALAALALLAACTPPAQLPPARRVAPPPREWTARDLEVPRGPAVLPTDSAAPRHTQPGGYPADAARVFRSGVAVPPEAFRPASEGGTPVRITEVAARRILAVLPAVDRVPLRTAVWPGAARVVQHDSLGALVATEPVALVSLAREVRCPGGAWPQTVPVRMEAYVAAEGGVMTVRPRMAVGRPAGAPAAPECQLAVTAQDRVAAFGADVAAALRQASRMGMPVPIRARP